MGKSYALQAEATTAMLQGNKVLLINLEMTDPQIKRRVYQQLMAVATRNSDMSMPFFYKDTEDFDEKWKIDFKKMHHVKYNPTVEDVKEFHRKFKMYNPHSDLRVLSFPTKSLTIKQLRQELDNLLFFENWEPSVVLIDYIDIMKFQGNDQQYVAIDDLYAEMRGLALERNICIGSATQANREGGNSAVVDRQHTSGSIGKLSHVTSCNSLTATKEERSKGIYRISQVVEREGETISDQVVALSMLGIGQMFYDSRFLCELEYKLAKDEKDENTKSLQKM
jgi:hypothetical protein